MKSFIDTMKPETKLLSELCVKVKSGGTPRSDNPLFYGGDIPFVTIDDMTSSSKYLDATKKTITKLGLSNSNCWKVPVDSILYSIYASLGVTRINKIEAVTNQAILALIPDKEKIDAEYLFYYLSFLENKIHQLSSQTTQSNLSGRIVKNFPILYLDPKEQTKIAEVLSTIDRAIAQTKALIAKHQRIKTGLMQDLLTRGIDEHGELRNSVAHPDQFTKSDFGLFPKAWKITTLGKIIADTKGLIQTGPFGTQVHAYDYAEEGIPTMMPQYIDETGWIELENLPRLTPAKALELRRHVLRENDVIFARRGELSKCSAISKREEGWICGTDFMLVRVSSSIMSGEWFAHYYRDDIGQRQVMAQAVGSIMKGINTPLMASLIVALPSIEEQTRILAIIDSQAKIIKETVDQHKKLLKIKQGLMQDLLSGEVSVTPLLEG